MNLSIKKEISRIVGSNNVLDSYESRLTYSYDSSPLEKKLPELVVRPGSTEEVAKLVSLANIERFAIIPRGSGTGLSGGSLPVENSVVVLFNHWNKIIEIDQDNLTVMVEPGVITANLQAEVEKIGLMYPPDPGSSSISTIGGNVAENAGGLRGLKYGVTKNYVMGLELVLPTGEIIFTGGKCVKDVAGYNLKDLLIGSEGTLGVITKILLRVIPKIETARTFLVFYASMEDAAQTVSEIIRSKITPSMLEFLDNTTIRCIEEYTHIGLPVETDALLLIEIDGKKSVVDEEANLIHAICKNRNAVNIKYAESEEESLTLKKARRAAFASLARAAQTTLSEDVAVPRSEIARLVRRIKEIGAKYNVRIGTFGHAGDGNLHPNYLTDRRDKIGFANAEKAIIDVEEAAIQLGGTITGEHGVGLYKKRLLEKMIGSPAVRMMRMIKELMDPMNVINPGKIIDFRPKCEGPLPIMREQIKEFKDIPWI